MHQTEGTNFNAADPDITGRAFQQEIDGVQPGSVMFAEWANAVQQEIVNVIVSAGLTVSATAADDRTALWGQMSEAIFNSEAIGSSAITDNSITFEKMATNSIETTSLVFESVIASKLAPDSVTEVKILDSAVTADKIATDAVTENKIALQSVTQNKIGNQAVGSAQLKDANVTLVKMATDTKAKYQIKNGTPGALPTGTVIDTFSNLTQGKFYRVTFLVNMQNVTSNWASEIQVNDGNPTTLMYTDDEQPGTNANSCTVTASRIFQAAANVGGESLELKYVGANNTSLVASIFQLEELPLMASTAIWA